MCHSEQHLPTGIPVERRNEWECPASSRPDEKTEHRRCPVELVSLVGVMRIILKTLLAEGRLVRCNLFPA